MENMQYTAEDGFSFLKYLGLDLTLKEEQELFREYFAKLYGTSQRYDLIGTCWQLYSDIPLIIARYAEVHIAEEYAFRQHMERDSEFYEALRRTDVQEKLRQGIPLDEILNKKEVTE